MNFKTQDLFRKQPYIKPAAFFGVYRRSISYTCMSSSCKGIFQTSNEDETLRANPERTCGWEHAWIVEDVVWEEDVRVTLGFRPKLSGRKVMQARRSSNCVPVEMRSTGMVKWFLCFSEMGKPPC